MTGMTMPTAAEHEVLMRLIEAYADARHEHGAPEYNAHTMAARNALYTALLHALTQTGGWLPIETAPKDGTEILVYFGSMGVRQVSWDSQYTEGSDSEWAIWCVDDNKHGPYPLRGWNHNGPNAPTHWMHLPPSPAAEREVGA